MPRLSAPVAVVVSAALLASVGAGSYAAGSLVTSKQIKDGTIKVEDLSPRAVERLRGSTGPAGAPGPAGATGATGGQGARGASAWDQIPSGQTVTGRFHLPINATGPDAWNTISVALPGRPASPPRPGVNTFFAPNPDAPSGQNVSGACTGTYEQPTAPPGMTCIYIFGTAVWSSLADKSLFGEKEFTVIARSRGTVNSLGMYAWAHTEA